MRIIAIILMCLGIASCATPVQHDTASGRPEVVVLSSDVTAVKGALISRMLDRGYIVTRESDYLVTFDKRIENVLAAALLGSRYDSTPNARVTYTIAKLQGRIRVIADLAVVTNPGSAFERLTNANANEGSLAIQDVMNFAKIDVEAG